MSGNTTGFEPVSFAQLDDVRKAHPRVYITAYPVAAKKAVLRFYGETWQSMGEYYFMDGKLFFVYKVMKHYLRPMTVEGAHVEEDRYYFYNQKLIRWIDGSGKIADKKLYPEKEKEVLGDLEDIFKK